jgi:hypothetical protein
MVKNLGHYNVESSAEKEQKLVVSKEMGHQFGLVRRTQIHYVQPQWHDVQAA